MEKETVLKEFKDTGAILQGHFILSSGLHSDTYLQWTYRQVKPGSRWLKSSS